MPHQPPLVDSPLWGVMTIAEISQVYGVEASTVRRACLNGWIPARQSGKTWLVLRKDADERWNTTQQPTLKHPAG